MEDFESKYTGEEVEDLLDQVADGVSMSYNILSGEEDIVTIEQNTINIWQLSNENVIRSVVINSSNLEQGKCELWVVVGATKPREVNFYIVAGEPHWRSGKRPQFDVNKMYKICFEWHTNNVVYGSWEEYPMYDIEGQQIPITVMDLNIKTSYGIEDHSWASRKEEMFGFLKGKVANDKGYTAPKCDIIGLQEIYIHGTQWNDIMDAMGDEYDSIIANRGDSSSYQRDSEAVAILYRKDRFSRLSGGYFWLRGGGWNGDTGNFNQEGFATWDSDKLSSNPSLSYDNYKRIAVWVILSDHATGKSFFVLNTHYNKYFYSDGKTAASTPYYSSELVKNRIDALSGGRPVIFMGDLHCNPDKSAVAILKPDYYSLRDTRDEAEEVMGMKYTMNSWAEEDVSPTYALFDYIFVKGDWKVNQHIVPYAKVDGVWISDHNPVIADLYLKV